MEKRFRLKKFHSLSYNIENLWPLVYPDHIVNLLLVHRIKREREKESAEVASILRDGLMHYDTSSSQIFQYRFGLMDDQLYYKKFETTDISEMFASFQTEDCSTIEPKLILINGPPGMGKTTLCKEIAFLWANKKLLVDTKMIFLLFLRDPAIQKIRDLKDLILYFYKFDPSYLYLSHQCAEILAKRDNSDITILMDGYDELVDKENHLLIKNIIGRKVLSQCKIVITSRAIASENLQKDADVRVEVLGFTEQSKMIYIQKEFKNHPEKIKSLLSYLNVHSDINQVCHVPIMMTILVCTYKEYGELPNNESELYENFIISTILRYVKELNDNCYLLDELQDELQDECKKHLQQLSEFAFKTIESGKVIFTDVDIKSLCPNLAFSGRKLQGLGLFKVTEHLNIEKTDNCVRYNFLHLSIHEFLVAYYLKSLKNSEQFQILRRTFFVINVWVMFISLQKSLYDFHHLLMYSVSKEQIEIILQKLHHLDVHGIRHFHISDINGTFQLLCCKNDKEDFETDVIHENFIVEFDSWCLFPFSFTSNWTKLFASLCCVDSSGPLIEVYLLDKNTKDILYHQIVRELKQNPNLSVILVSSNALVGYRSNYYQLTNAVNMNRSLDCIVLKYCLINKDVANTLSSYFINSHSPKYLCITDCRSDQMAFLVILQALMKISKIKVLDLHGNNMTGQVIKHLATVIENNSDLEELCLSHNDLKTSVTMILHALKENSKLKKLLLNNNNMTGNAAEDLAYVIKNNSNLEQLGLGNNKFGSSADVILQALTQNSKLKLLNLTNNNITGQTVKQLANVIKNNRNLNQLRLASNMLGPSAIVILKALKENCKLKILHLQNNNMTGRVAEDLANVIKNNSCLEEIFLSNNYLDSSALKILQALKENSKLKSLDLSSNNMTEQVAEHLGNVIKNNPNLEHLSLGNSKLGPSAAVVLEALTQNSKLKLLNLNDNKMTKQVVKHLASVIKNNSNLNYLGLANNLLGPSANVILQTLKENKKLQIIHLRNNNMTEKVAEDLANVIKNNIGLEEILISHNDLKSSAAVVLQALKEGSKLKILDLSSNSMTEQVAEDLANVIKANSNLEQLNLGNNKLGPSTRIILQALKGNSKLVSLNLNSNNMTGQAADDLASVIKSNSSLEKLYLSENGLKSSAVIILQALKGNSKLRFLDLNSNNMTGQVAEYLADVIMKNPNLEQLGLRNNKLGQYAVLILQALMRNSKLTVLNLNKNKMTGQVAKDLAQVIKNNSNLQELYLSDNDLKSSAGVIFQALIGIKHLKILSFTNNYVPHSFPIDMTSNNPFITELWLGGNMLQSRLIDVVVNCRSLTFLKVMEVSHNSISPTEVVHLASLVSKISSLQALMFDGMVLNAKERFHVQFYDASKQILMANSHSSNENELFEIMHLEMWRTEFADRMKFCYDIKNYFSTDVRVMQINNFCADRNLYSLLSVVKQAEQTLSCLDATNMIVSLFSIIKTVKVLDLGYSNIKKEAADKLAEALNYNNVLEQLWLRGNRLGLDKVGLILTSLQNIFTLRLLDLSYNNIGSTSADGIAAVIISNHFLEQLWLDGNMLMTTGVAIIADALNKHFNLKLLSLSNNGITEDAAEKISAIVNNNTLLGLLLSNNQLESIGTYEIAESCGGMKFLHILELTNNRINATAADELAITLTNCACLKEFYLGNNNLATTGAVKICQALKYTPILQVLALNNNNISTEAASIICNVINTNSNLDILLLGGNNLQTTGVVQIADTIKNNNIILQLLSLSDNNVDEQDKDKIKVMLCDQCGLELII